MLDIQVQITGDSRAISQLDTYKSLLRSFAPEYQAVGQWWVGFLKGEVFSSAGATYNRAWARLSTPYAFIKEKLWGNTGILIASGALRAGWNMYTTADYLIVKNEAQSRRGDYYGAFHQEGTGNMPARPLLLVDSGRAMTIRDLITMSLNKRLHV